MNEEQSNIMLNNALSVKNASIMKKFLTEDNFEVVRIKPVKPMKGIRYNTIVEIRQPIDPKASPVRYRITSHKLMRVDLKEAMRHIELNENKNGTFTVTSIPTDVAGVISLFEGKITFVEDDLYFNKADDKTCSIRAKVDSLGFIGLVTLTTENDNGEPEVPEDPK